MRDNVCDGSRRGGIPSSFAINNQGIKHQHVYMGFQ